MFLTVDQDIPHQQNLAAQTISILSTYSHTNQIADLLPVVATILSILAAIQRGRTTLTS